MKSGFLPSLLPGEEVYKEWIPPLPPIDRFAVELVIYSVIYPHIQSLVYPRVTGRPDGHLVTARI